MYKTIWSEELETLTPEEQRALERERLATQLGHVYANSPFGRRKFEEAGVTPAEIRDVPDLARLPFTTKAELRESQERQPPFGDFLAVPVEAIATVHRTSGSTGKFIYTALTRGDMDQTNEYGAITFWAGGPEAPSCDRPLP